MASHPRSLNIRRGARYEGADGTVWRAANGYTLVRVDPARKTGASPLTVTFVQQNHGPLRPLD